MSAPTSEATIATPPATTGSDDDDRPPMPSEEEENAYLTSEENDSPPPADITEEESDNAPLPALDELINKLSPESKALLETLYRARFTGVRKVSVKDLKRG